MSWGLIVAAGALSAVVVALVAWRDPVLGFAGRSLAYLREVRAEVRKVSWPSWDDLRKSTTVIIIFVIVIGLVIGVMDFVLSKLLIDVLGRAFG